MAGYERKIVQLLKESGFSVIRNPRGSHVIWGKDSLHIPVLQKSRSVTLPMEFSKSWN